MSHVLEHGKQVVRGCVCWRVDHVQRSEILSVFIQTHFTE